MEFGMSNRKLTGKCYNCGKQGYKVAECWSGGKNTTLQLMHTLLVDHAKVEQIVKREI